MAGGGMLGLAHVGALDALESRGLLRCVKEYVGVSAGALVAFGICIGYTVAEMRSINTAFDFSLIQNLDPEALFMFMESYGLDNGQNFDKLLSILLRKKGLSPTITFAEFAQQFPDRPQPRIYATNIQTCLKKEFSAKESPDAALKLAVLASAAIPLVFSPVRDGSSGELLVDGGLIIQSPFHHLSDEERAETICLSFNRRNKVIEDDVPINNISAFFRRIYYSIYYHQDRAMHERWGHRIAYLETGNLSPFKFGATSEEKEALFQSGRTSMENFLKTEGRAAPARRNSCP